MQGHGRLPQVQQAHPRRPQAGRRQERPRRHAAARERGATVVALTDSRLGPVAAAADAVLTVQQAELFGFRTLSSTMCLAQALYIAVAYRLQNP